MTRTWISIPAKFSLEAGADFTCDNYQGAMLTVKDGHAMLWETDSASTKTLGEHMRHNYKAWTRQHCERCGIEGEELVLVTGVMMTRDWEAAVWKGSSSQRGGRLNAGVPLIFAGADYSRQSSIQHSPECNSGHKEASLIPGYVPKGRL